MAKRHIKNNLVFNILFCSILTIYVILLFSLFFFAFYTSCKSVISDFTFNKFELPKRWVFENYIKIFQNLKMAGHGIGTLFLGSFFYSIMCSVAFVLATTLMAYACTQFPCKLSKVINFLVLFMIVVPIIGSAPSEYRIVRLLHINDTIFGGFWFSFTFGNIYFLIISEGLRAIPQDFKEAAQVDGASLFRIMVQIILPLCMNIIGSVLVVTFVAKWNDYNTPLLYFNSFPNISLGLMIFNWKTGSISAPPFKMGACLVVFLPILILFAFFQKTLLGSLAAGGVKG